VIDGCLFYFLSAADVAAMVADRTREEAADGTFVFVVEYVRHDAETKTCLADGARAGGTAGCSADPV